MMDWRVIGVLLAMTAAPAAMAQRTAQSGPQGLGGSLGGSVGGNLGAAALERELVLTNRAGRPITRLHVSASDTDDWGGDRLAGGTLRPGASLRIRLGHGRNCRFDVTVTYADGRQEEADDVDACAARKLAFDGSSAQASDDGSGLSHQVTLTDRTPLDIAEIYMSAPSAADWGDDRLGDTDLPSGGSTMLSYRGGCLVDLRVVFENKAAEERQDLNICVHPKLAIAPGWTTREGEEAPVPPPPASIFGGLTLRNRSGHDIAELYAYPDGAEQQGPDLLGESVVPDGSTLPLAFDAGGMCRGTLRAVLAGHAADLVRSGMDLCATHQVTFTDPATR